MEELKGYPLWVRYLAEKVAVEDITKVELAKEFGKSRSIVQKYLGKKEIKDWIELRREDIFNQIRSKVSILVPKAYETYQELLDQKGTGRLKFEAAKDVMRGTKVFGETEELELTGGIKINVIVPPKENE